VARDDRIPILYLAPWVDLGGSDKATVDWFRWLDRERFAPTLMTTQPSLNRWLGDVRPFATEVWALPDLMPADKFPRFIFEFIESRGIELVHIMNSRIGFDLLPDLASMQPRPATVVQLHVEEEDRTGYVRYVTTRYGNLVDAFSVTGHHLSAAMADYHVPAAKRRVIHTGVDADGEFNRDVIVPQRIAIGHFHVLFPARLVPQKDPQLMLDVAAGVVAERPDALFHVLGDGPLEHDLRTRAAERGLGAHVIFHGPASDVRPWYAACDALLMTSTFEGIPVAVFEAFAMRLPVVAPALPGIAELAGDCAAALITPRDDAAAYVRALIALASDEPHRLDVAERAHARVCEHFGVGQMADAHAALYDELLEARAGRTARHAARSTVVRSPGRDDGESEPSTSAALDPARSGRIALLDRPSAGQPPVSIVVPCFNHGLFLPACLASIRAQDYPEIEVIVVDDASTDDETRAVIDELEAEGWAHVIRQRVNRGPSAARNAALDIVRGRYVLPVDADNLLLPDAVRNLVAQLQVACETIGFIYPNLQFFGNRNEYFAAPDYNLHALLLGNYCDTCSLFDRTVFDAGIRFADDIELGHEDWDLVLQLAARGVRGEPAHAKTLLYRTHGFTRSEFVEYAQAAFHDEIPRRHPTLFSDPSIKPRDCPGLSIVVLDELKPGALGTVAERLRRQSLVDVELIASFDEPWPRPDELRCVRRIPPGECDDSPAMLALGLQLARSPRVLAITHGLADLLADRAALEKIARASSTLPSLDAIAFVDAGEDANPLAPVADPATIVGVPHAALLLRANSHAWSSLIEVSPGYEIGTLLAPVTAARNLVQWYHLPARPRTAALSGEARWVRYARTPPARAREQALRELHADEPVRTPGVEILSPRRWSMSNAWTPPGTTVLVRHVNPVTGRRVISNSRIPPTDYVIERDLGVIPRGSPPGTARLECNGGASYDTVHREAPVNPDPAVVVLGHVEQAPLPLLASLLCVTHRPTGQQILLSGDDDPLADDCDVHRSLGFIEGFPIYPREPRESRNSDYGLHGLLRTIDRGRRRHVYAVDSTPAGCELVGELGALLGTPVDDAIALWLLPGALAHTDAYRPSRAAPAPAAIARWALAPAAWRDFGHHRGRARAVARRMLDAPRLLVGAGNGGHPADPMPAGYLFIEAAPGRLPLWSGVNPVTGDQLLTRHEYEANDMGYTNVTLLGFMRERAPVTGTLDVRRAAIPWASRFGLKVRPV
jgi:glycosyltransferase involved in cell wall biosynthesis